MKNVLRILLLIIIVAVVSIIIDRVFFVNKHDLAEAKKQAQNKIDSLNTVINFREDSLLAISNKISNYEHELTSLRAEISKKNRQINFYKNKGRFEYEASNDSLYRELNDILKLRVNEVVSAADSIPR